MRWEKESEQILGSLSEETEAISLRLEFESLASGARVQPILPVYRPLSLALLSDPQVKR